MIPVLPENAPFTPAQRAWLNGFFAGLLSRAPGTGSAGLMGAAAAGAANGSGQTAVAAVDEEEEFPWHDATLSIDERLELAAGRPAEQVLMAAMAQLDCGTCGYLCQSYAEAIARGEETDLSRCVPGGKETARKLKELVSGGTKDAAAEPRPSPAPAALGAAGTVDGRSAVSEAAPDRKRPFPARMIQAARLNRHGSAKDVRHVVLDLRGSGLRYEVGDSLGIYPENCPELVAKVLAALKATGEEPVTGRDGTAIPARAALAREYVVNRISPKLLAHLAEWAADPSEARRLRSLGEEDADGFLEGHDLLDLLELFPSVRGPIDQLIPALSPLQPRLYSIASSLKAHPDEVHLTVGVVRYSRRGCPRARKGVASTFLAERVGAGAKVDAFVQPSHGFRLPSCGDTPILMVGPGTGVAPFRAFLQERLALGATGKHWLFFGDQRREVDFLYQEELEGYLRSGLLARLDLAFSRDQEQKIYVQHRMLEHAAQIWAWLEEGACLYVCGDAQRMARDVDQALHRIIAEQGCLSQEETRSYVTALKRAKRYQRDVY